MKASHVRFLPEVQHRKRQQPGQCQDLARSPPLVLNEDTKPCRAAFPVAFGQRDGHPQAAFATPELETEFRRHDAHDSETLAVHFDCTADEGPIAAVAPLPPPVAEDDAAIYA